MTVPLLVAENLRCGYHRGSDIVHGVSLAAGSGDFTALIGPNGSGKTTIFRSLGGYLRPSSGSVRFKGEEVSRMPPHRKARAMAMVLQNVFSPHPYTAREIVEMGRLTRLPLLARLSSEDGRQATKAMESLGVAHLAERRFSELSGGERQLVMVATALAQEPELLLLDEPTSHLDIARSARLMGCLAELNTRTGLAVLIVSHDISLAARFCRRIFLLKNGAVVAEGPPAEVVTAENLSATFDGHADIEKMRNARGKERFLVEFE